MAVLGIVPASPRLEQTLWLESGELETQERRGLVLQSVELWRQLQEEQASYRRKLQAYQEGQQRQAQLVQQLQGWGRGRPCPPPAQPGALASLPPRTQSTAKTWGVPSSGWRRNNREGQGWQDGPLGERLLIPCAPLRSASLVQVNAMLREQLDQAGLANQALSEEIRKVTSDWTRSRKELEQWEAAWSLGRKPWGLRAGTLL
nr:rootletin-like [Pongo abelii]